MLDSDYAKREVEKLLTPLPKEERERLVNGKFEPSIADDFQTYGMCATLNGERIDPRDLFNDQGGLVAPAGDFELQFSSQPQCATEVATRIQGVMKAKESNIFYQKRINKDL